MNQLQQMLDLLTAIGYSEVKHYTVPQLKFKQYYLTKRRDRILQRDFLELFLGGDALGTQSMMLFQFDDVGTLVNTGGHETSARTHADGL